MKYDLNELVFAAHLREITSELRRAAAAREHRSLQGELNGERITVDAYLAVFAQSHPLEGYVPQALEQLRSLADVARIALNR